MALSDVSVVALLASLLVAVIWLPGELALRTSPALLALLVREVGTDIVLLPGLGIVSRILDHLPQLCVLQIDFLKTLLQVSLSANQCGLSFEPSNTFVRVLFRAFFRQEQTTTRRKFELGYFQT